MQRRGVKELKQVFPSRDLEMMVCEESTSDFDPRNCFYLVFAR